jgi:hypothetical protein
LSIRISSQRMKIKKKDLGHFPGGPYWGSNGYLYTHNKAVKYTPALRACAGRRLRRRPLP